MIAVLQRNWDIAKAALAEDRASAASRARYDVPAFLPAALEIMETPPNPLGRALLRCLSAMVVVVVLWSIIGQVDVVVVAAGKTLPHARVQTISWGGSGSGAEGTTGVVRRLYVTDGDHVSRGQLLIELDPTINDADAAQAQRGLASAEIEQARSRALVEYLNTGHLGIAMPPTVPAGDAATQAQLIRSAVSEYEAKAGGLRQARAERAADMATAQTEQQKLRETLVLLDRELAARTELAAKGYQSKLLLLQLQQVRIERARNIDEQVSAAAKARAAMAGIDQQLRQLRQELTKGSLTELAKASDDASLRREELTKADRRNALLQIRAPVSGSVEQLQVHTIGGTVQAAQPILTIVPDNSLLAVEAQVENRDIGFVHVGQPVAVKVEAFPFTEYGLLHGKVMSISNDAVAVPDAGGNTAGSRAPVFIARIRLDRTVMMVGDCDRAKSPSSSCKPVPLSPGMSLQVEIKTGQRRIINYLLSPLSKAGSEAGRER